MSTQIADGLEREFGPADSELSERDRREHSRHQDKARTPGVQDFMSDLLDGQMRLITAQYQFLRDNDMTALAIAQRDMVSCQTAVLNRLGVFG